MSVSQVSKVPTTETPAAQAQSADKEERRDESEILSTASQSKAQTTPRPRSVILLFCAFSVGMRGNSIPKPFFQILLYSVY